MAIKRYGATKTNTITNAFQANLSTRGTGSNMGEADVMEVFSLYGQASAGTSRELSRVLVDFPVLTTIATDRSAGKIPASGSVNFVLKLTDAPHVETTPRNFTLNVAAVSRSWEQGTGLDTVNYTDLGFSNWLMSETSSSAALINNLNVSSTPSSDETISITIPAGYADFAISTTFNIYITSSLTPAASGANLYIATGSSNINLSAATLHNIIATGINGNAIANTSSIGAAFANLKNYISAISSPYGVSLFATYGGSIGESIVLSASTSHIKTTSGATNFSLNIPWVNQGGDFLTGSSNYVGSQTFVGGTENLSVDVTTLVEQQLGGTIGAYGFGVFLTSSLESALTSYYTKKFFASGSEYYFYRPTLEARWNSSLQDDTNNFYMSSSLADAASNINTLYLYNVVRGQLKNIPAVGTNAILLTVHTASGAPAIQAAVTGGWVSTGIYSASIVYTGSATSIYPVWFSGSVQYHTGSEITVNTLDSSDNYYTTDFYCKITNLKTSYTNNENPSFRLYTRPRNWSPTIYVVANVEPQSTILKNVYYKIFRIVDNYEVIGYGTGSAQETLMSYDKDGNYFNLDMSMFEPGYMYGIKVMFKLNDSEYKEQPEVFKFKVI